MTARHRAWPVFGLLGLALAVYLLVPLDAAVQRLWYNGTAATALLLGFRGLHIHRPAHLRGWVLVLVGFSGWVVGDVVWFVQESLGAARFPAPSDAVYLCSYVVLAAGVLAIVRTRRSGGDRAAFLDAAILTTGAAVPAVVFMVAPLFRDDSLGVAARLVSTAYPVGDLFLLTALARMLTSPGAQNRSFRLLLAALAVTAAADTAWNVMLARSGNTAVDSHLLDAGWLCAYVLVAAATNTTTMSLVAEPTPPTDAVLFGRRRVAAMGVGLLLPIVVLFVDGLRVAAADWLVIASGAAVMCVLVLVRFVGLLSIAQTQAVQLAALALTDPLTGASNRRTLDHELSQACLRARDHDTPLSVAILDLDHFKAFNDTYGHQAGDQLLREAVATWTDALPAGATLARYGGEEFAVLLPGHRVDAAEAVVAVLRDGTPRDQTFSAGIAEWGRADSPAALVAAADSALYRAKRSGRNRTVTATDSATGRRADAAPIAAEVPDRGSRMSSS